MQAVCDSARLMRGIGAALVVGLAMWGTRSLAATNAARDSVKIEPYTGPPIFLEGAEQTVKPTLVSRETLREKYEDGKTIRVEREVAHYSDDNFAADGAYREFHPNGKPFIEGRFKAGRQEGDWTYYFENGQINRKATFVDGKPNGSWEIYREDGTLAAKRGFKDGVRDGEWSSYDETGKQQLTEEHYVKGEADGVWKAWFPNGKLKQQVAFKLGKREGLSAEWDDKGQKVIEAEYADGKLNGKATRFLPDGKTIVQQYKDGKFVSEVKR